MSANIAIIVQRCGNCRNWSRGGVGSGRGGGYCIKYTIPKNKNNTLAATECFKQYPSQFRIERKDEK